MKIHYKFPTKRTLIIDDHWEVPIQNGSLRAIEIKGKVDAFEITIKNQPVAYAMQFIQANDENMATIIHTDPLLAPIQNQLNAAMSFLHCYFSVDLKLDDYEVRYEAETPDEEGKIPIPTMKTDQHELPLPLPFDMLTRAIMAAESSSGPQFEATLTSFARAAIGERRYIDSFRYSFLLIESVYGGGQFKTAALKSALKQNHPFREIVRLAISDRIKPHKNKTSDTEALLSQNPSIDIVIDHLVEKRGFYFHGNIKRQKYWKPNDQTEAESLANLAVGIAQLISHEAATPMFDENYGERHFKNAKSAGAIIVFEIKFKYKNPEESFSREHMLNISVPGTKPTPQNSLYILEQFIEHFKHHLPVSGLDEAICKVKDSPNVVFEIKMYPVGRQ
ncbi:hypothetical protein [Vreelandella malpeensis]|uniref:Uncharacterized protein n=1 Tax=Vreelandella malpeensis TaxID=1172368 RepID=A0ABS8DR19_9GAMM|nr:hypothetical protein [Halomonas malpeensis]MCB8888768.1 hypothetical protein [Halomonas malpeensis]